ncbi:hypothetical protein EDD72_11423 [Tepidibacillus fermentans]|uniref:Uncharacterized protein n=1 Tax=Tepidibacillus fermentans TaxID=1281767 RepID=A0A4R3KCT3_9BACI|nr:hypothetical protein EDD72_11423 [Tepidibacillus fermentans]
MDGNNTERGHYVCFQYLILIFILLIIVFLVKNQGFLPNNFTIQDYLNRTRNLNITGGAIVSGSFQGFDQNYLREALKILGPSFVGVTQLPLVGITVINY